jgi:ABC-type nitrate/sulfonate/bicarbonate transport system substrate-binding protein
VGAHGGGRGGADRGRRARGGLQLRRGRKRQRNRRYPAAGGLPTNVGPAEKTTLNVAVVPAMDSAGFFIALHDGLFAKEGLTVNYSPAVSSETAVAQQPKGQLDITGGNYVSYINEAAVNHAPVEVVAEGSIMQQGAQPILTMPDSNIATLGQLKDRVVGVNAPGNIDYLLGVSVLQENGIPPKNVVFPPRADPVPADGRPARIRPDLRRHCRRRSSTSPSSPRQARNRFLRSA